MEDVVLTVRTGHQREILFGALDRPLKNKLLDSMRPEVALARLLDSLEEWISPLLCRTAGQRQDKQKHEEGLGSHCPVL